jgi:imidazolonepropionase-like amidohydrolase
MEQNPAVGQRRLPRFLVEHPGAWIPGLYLLASAIGMLDSWWYFRQFGIDVFLYSDVADFLLASFRSPTAWLTVALTVLLGALDHTGSIRTSRSGSVPRWLRWHGSRRYRQTGIVLGILLVTAYIAHFARARADAIYEQGAGRGVRVSLAGGPADAEPAILLGSTLNFMFLLHRADARVSIHPYENVLAIESRAPRDGEVATSSAAQPVAGADGDLYFGFTRVDPNAQQRVPNSWVVVRDGRIAEMGAGAQPVGDFAARRDMTGSYGMPGLIDAHAHITIAPFETGVENGAPFVGFKWGDEYSRSNAAIALAFGVTTVRNPAGVTAANQEYDAMIASGAWAGPEARHAGAIIQPPPSGGDAFAYPTTPAEWDAEASDQAAAGMTYFKLYTDLTEDEIASGIAAARAHGLIPIAHLDGVSWTRAADLGVRQIEHALPTSSDLLDPEARAQFVRDPFSRHMFTWFELADLDGPLLRQMIETLLEQGVVVNLTLMVNEIVYNADRFDALLPKQDYYHPDTDAAARGNYAAIATIWSQEDFTRARAVWPKVLRFAKLLYDSGVPLMIGTDGTGGTPVYARELSHHVEAGISAWDVLRMATSGNADLMGLGEETGRFAEGYEADLVFLSADPSADVRNVGEVALVVNNGEAYEPQSLLDIAHDVADAARARAAAQTPPAP